MNQVAAEHAPAGVHPAGAHPAAVHPSAVHPVAEHEGQQHPIRIYLVIWGLLFLFSVCSYLIDYFDLQGVLRWTLIITFMLLKAGFIVAIFMHMAWERLALKIAILLPPLSLLVLIGLMAIEGDYTFVTRLAAFVTGATPHP
jgi:cytochrome c oxidase subunit 4